MPSCGVSFIMSTSYTCSRLKVFQKFTMKTVFPSPGPASTTIIPPLVWACSTKSTALDRSFDLPKNCLCIASWWTSCSNTSDAASASSASCEMCNYEVFIEPISKVQHWRKSKNKDTEVDHIRRFYLYKQNSSSELIRLTSTNSFLTAIQRSSSTALPKSSKFFRYGFPSTTPPHSHE